jgi:CRP-like cAMP-binding protein
MIVRAWVRTRRSKTIGRFDLGRLPLFAGCRPRELERLSRLGTQLRLRAGRRLMTAGTRGVDVVLILAGAATCEIGDRSVARFEAGDFVGEVAVLDGRPRTATVTAITDMEVLVLSASEFDQVASLSPLVSHRILVAMAQRIRGANSLATAAS